MRLLLDTQLLVWMLRDSPRATKVRPLIEADGVVPVFSLVSLWEVVIKNSLGRVDFDIPPDRMRARLIAGGTQELPILADHILAVAHLPPIHRDPFDRLLVAQAAVEEITLLTADKTIGRYPAPICVV